MAVVLVLAVVGALYFWAQSSRRKRAIREELRWFEHEEGDMRIGMRWSVDFEAMRMTEEHYDRDEEGWKREFRVRRADNGRWEARNETSGEWDALPDVVQPPLETQYQRFRRHYQT